MLSIDVSTSASGEGRGFELIKSNLTVQGTVGRLLCPGPFGLSLMFYVIYQIHFLYIIIQIQCGPVKPSTVVIMGLVHSHLEHMTRVDGGYAAMHHC